MGLRFCSVYGTGGVAGLVGARMEAPGGAVPGDRGGLLLQLGASEGTAAGGHPLFAGSVSAMEDINERRRSRCGRVLLAAEAGEQCADVGETADPGGGAQLGEFW
ncbi:hypothetical protein CYMTET_54759 [Cymbomonas tetramitiformis]|uniref:Uncharacterized protein n=1 Tax=Cymbomonas tetramitiformis TaxID=36881 RepID=A0AAE0BE95_9CHLO|nr:hypothetical protein CYMTET_54759 [Cymbomonas tetramitiformis]